MKWDMFFHGAMFMVFPNVPEATFIQGAMLIPESRVVQITIHLKLITLIQNPGGIKRALIIFLELK